MVRILDGDLVYEWREGALPPGREDFSKDGTDADAARFGLSPRETEVACLLISGLAYKEIGASIGVSMATVKTHVNRIYQKCGASNKIELMKFLCRR